MSPAILSALMVVLRYFVAGAFAALVHAGVVKTADAGPLTDAVATILFGAIGFLATMAWGLYRSRLAAKIADVAAAPSVTSIHATPEVAAAQPSAKVVSVPPANP